MLTAQTTFLDISDEPLFGRDPELLEILLRDHTLSDPKKGIWRNITWATHDYASQGKEYAYSASIRPEHVMGDHQNIVQPRIHRDEFINGRRVKEMAEVYTPSWICNAQNNMIDRAWFGRRITFNTEVSRLSAIGSDGKVKEVHTWITTPGKIRFPKRRSWKTYVKSRRMEVTCGEGPYLTSRYDTTNGEYIPVMARIGVLDRKLRVLGENVTSRKEWSRGVRWALQSVYGFEWQGDNLAIARIQLLYTTIEHYMLRWGRRPQKQSIRSWAEIISWNLWQMDLQTYNIPGTSIPCWIRDWNRWNSRHKEGENKGYDGEYFYESVKGKADTIELEPSLF